MQPKPKKSAGGIYLIVVIVIIVFSLVLVGDNSTQFGQNPNPLSYRQAIPRSSSGSHAVGSQNDQTNLQVNNFDFITLTPTPIPGQPPNPCDASIQGRCHVCWQEEACTSSTAGCPAPPNNFICFPQILK